jgi:predicted transcriptional regulator
MASPRILREMEPVFCKTVGKNIRSFRLPLGLTQESLAEKAGLLASHHPFLAASH